MIKLIDVCGIKYYGHYIIRSLNGITYIDLGFGIKMIMV